MAVTRTHPGVRWLDSLLLASVLPDDAPTTCTLSHLALAAGSLSVLYDTLWERTRAAGRTVRRAFSPHYRDDQRLSPQVIWQAARLFLHHQRRHYEENAACLTYGQAQGQALLLANQLNQALLGHDSRGVQFDPPSLANYTDQEPLSAAGFEAQRQAAAAMLDNAHVDLQDEPLALLVRLHTNLNAHAREKALRQHQRAWEVRPVQEKVAAGFERLRELDPAAHGQPLQQVLALSRSTHDAAFAAPAALPLLDWDVVDVLFAPFLLPPRSALRARRAKDVIGYTRALGEVKAYYRRLLQPAHLTTQLFVASILNNTNPYLDLVRQLDTGEQELTHLRVLCRAFQQETDPGPVPLPEVFTPPPPSPAFRRGMATAARRDLLRRLAEPDTEETEEALHARRDRKRRRTQARRQAEEELECSESLSETDIE